MRFPDEFQPVLGCGHCQTNRDRMHQLAQQEWQTSDGKDVPFPVPHAPCKACKLAQLAMKNSFDPLEIEDVSDPDDCNLTGSNEMSKLSASKTESGSESDEIEIISNAEVCSIQISWISTDLLYILQLTDGLATKTIPACGKGKQTGTKTKGAAKKHKDIASSSDTSMSKHFHAIVKDADDEDVDTPGLTPLSCSLSMSSLATTASISSLALVGTAATRVCFLATSDIIHSQQTHLHFRPACTAQIRSICSMKKSRITQLVHQENMGTSISNVAMEMARSPLLWRKWSIT